MTVTAAAPTQVAVLGAGSWGTAFAKVLVDAGCEVRLWTRRAEVAEQINTTHRNADYLPGVTLPRSPLLSYFSGLPGERLPLPGFRPFPSARRCG